MGIARSTALTIGGRRLDVLNLAGDPALRPLVLLHEGLGSIGLWRDFPAELARRTGRRTIAFSRHGHGHSESPVRPRTPAFFHEEARVVLPELMRQLDVAEPVLVGHSDGGSIALIHAGEAPVTGIVTLAAHVFVEDVCIRAIKETRERYVRGDLRARLARHHDDPDAAFWGWCNVWLDAGFRTWTLDAEAAAIDAPALVIQGREDPYGTLAQVERICAAIGASARPLVVPGGHSPHLDTPAEVVDAIRAFCESLP
ncbi:MAG TPA: alpha/beta fold hydrolase [Solirubrobacteraceae bacterium]|nr:alpha/beta fold hydrolase [Solirubrobacteraceae bacterium]